MSPHPAAPRFASLFGKPLRITAWIFGLSAAGLFVRAAYLEFFQSSELLAKDALVYTADGVKRPEHNPRLNLLAAMITRGGHLRSQRRPSGNEPAHQA